MVSLTAIREANAVAARALKGVPVAVFVGGTAGIGQGMAEAFGRLTNGNAHIVIVGRSQHAADEIIARIPKPSTSSSLTTWTHEFVQCDATLMKNVRKTSEEILQRHGKINYLVQSQGIMTTDGRTETEEGIDKKFALHYYSRWKFIEELLPALRRANEDGEDAKVLSVLGPGAGGALKEDDLGLVKGYTFSAVALQAPTYNDLMMEEFAARNPGLTFIHAAPGFVKTALAAKSPSTLIRVAGKLVNSFLLAPFGVTQDECAEYQWNAIFKHRDGAFRTGTSGQNIEKYRYYGNESQRKKVWEHTIELTQVSS